MAISSYHDVVILAESPRVEGGRLRAFECRVFESPVGQSARIEVVSLPDDLLDRSERLATRELDDDPGGRGALGHTLGALLLPPHARDLFRASLASLGEHEGLRLRLRLDPALASLPWESISITPDEGGAPLPLALDPRLSIVRHEALPVPADWYEAPAERRILVTMAAPLDRAPLEALFDEQRALRDALEGIPGLDTTFLPRLDGERDDFPSATPEQLVDALRGRHDIFHFSGHGERIDARGEPEDALMLADGSNRAVALSATRLAELLRGRGLRLAVLAACSSGHRDSLAPLSGVATALLRAGIPAVVAMQHVIDDRLAAAFSAALYRALVAGLSIDEAMVAGRHAIRAADAGGERRDWISPVLYLRARNGHIFRPVSDPGAAALAATGSAALVEQRVRRLTGRMVGAALPAVVEGTLEVEQHVSERAEGIMVGAILDRLEGRVRIRQEADRLDGEMIGLQIGGDRPSDEASARARLIERLELPLAPVGDRYCAACGNPVNERARFCTGCGAQL